MRKILIVFISLLTNMEAISQCALSSGNYEFAIKHDAHAIHIYARNTAAKIRSSANDVAANSAFNGLVFGVKWSIHSAISLLPVVTQAPFQITPSGMVLTKDNHQFQSYGDIAERRPSISAEWMKGQWNLMAIIPYEGELVAGDQFELAECGFHETTDPFFERANTQGQIAEFAPKIVPYDVSDNKGSIVNTVIVYPNPANGNLFVEISASKSTHIKIKLFDLSGKLIKVVETDLLEGRSKTIIDVSDLAKGIYLLKVSDGKTIDFKQKFRKD